MLEAKPSVKILPMIHKLPILDKTAKFKNFIPETTGYNFYLMFFTYIFQFIACLRSVPLFLLLLVLNGCQAPLKNKPVNSGQSVFFSPDRIRTIAVIPLNGTNAKRAKEMTRELTVQILQLNRFEVVDQYKVARLVEDEGLEGIDLSDTLVKNISSKLKADAILLGEITFFQEPESPYPILRKSPLIALSLRIVTSDPTEPKTIWSLNDTFDSKDRQVKQYVSRSERGKLAKDPSFLIHIVSKEIAKTFSF